MRILLLEDEPDIAEAVVDTLTRDHHHVTWAKDAAGAQAAIRHQAYDLAILDVILGEDEEAGFRFATTLRRAGFHGPMLFTTARDAAES